MVDRIAEIWGGRTPYAVGERWPVRVDLKLADGIAEADVDRWVQSACVLCSNGCATDIAVKDGRMVGVRGRAGDIVHHGRLGPKGPFGSWQGMQSDERLTRPLIGENGALVPTDWDSAMERIVARSRQLLDEDGPLSHGFHTSGQLFLEEYYALGIIGKAGLGTPHMDGNTRLCTATAAAAMKESFGSDGQPGTYLALMNGLVRELCVNGWVDEDYVAHTRTTSAAPPGSSARRHASCRRCCRGFTRRRTRPPRRARSTTCICSPARSDDRAPASSR